jgi:uncharacterized protein
VKYFLCVIGMVCIIEGIPYFAFPEKMKALLLKLHDVPDNVLRLLGCGAIIMGLLFVYFGRS